MDKNRWNPNIYQEIEWTQETDRTSKCINRSDFVEDYMICYKVTLPRTDVGHFTLSNSKELSHDGFFKEDNDIQTPGTPYLAPCHGDSGSGFWISVIDDNSDDSSTEKETIRYTLVAIHFESLKGNYNRNGKQEKGVCGGNVVENDGTRVTAAGVGIKVTNEKILEFIKKNAKICKVDSEGKCAIM